MNFGNVIPRALGVVLLSLVMGTSLWAQATTVQVVSPAAPVLRGATVSLDVDISNVSNLLASRVTVTFDNTKLQYTGSAAGGFMPAPPRFFNALVNGSMVTIDQSVLNQAAANGSGTLFTITFTALDAVSSSAIGLTIDLRDPANAPIPATATGGEVTVNNPSPSVTSINPTTKTAGDATFDLTVNGSGFVPTSVVWFKGAAHATTYNSAAQLTASIPVSDLLLAGSFPVTVVNPGPGGGTSPEIVNLLINPGPATTITKTSGDGQSAQISTTLAAPFVVTVTDAQGNLVPNTSVTFALETSPAGATGQALSITTTATDASGQASTVLTLGNKTGDYTASATSTGLQGSPVTFTATALAGALDHFNIGTIPTQTEGTPFDISLTAQDVANNTVTGFTGSVTLSANAGTIAPTSSGAFTGGVVTVQVTLLGAGAGRTISVSDGGTPEHTGISNAFEVLAMPNVFLSSSPAIAAPGILFPNTDWTVTTKEPDDWSFLAPTIVSVYVVPQPGMTFYDGQIVVSWNVAELSYVGVNFGSAGTPNGLFGTGQTYTHTELVTPGTGNVTIAATRTHGEFSPVSSNDYLARIDFTLLKPGRAIVTLESATFMRLPTIPVQVVVNPATIRAYLGDVASGPPPDTEPVSESTGDGQIDFQDLSAWSYSYWSGVDGYPFGLQFYKLKYDIGPTQDGSVFTLPVPDTQIEFEDLVVFSIAYGLSSTGGLLKVTPPSKEPVNVFLGAPLASGSETRIPVMLAGAVADVRAMQLKINGDFGAFLGVEKGTLLKEYPSESMVMSRSAEGEVFVDLAVMGLQQPGISKAGEVAVLRFEGTPSLRLNKYGARNSGNVALPLVKVQGAGEAVPTSYQLKQNYPNPFNPATTIGYEVPATGEVTLEVYNMLGQKVVTLVQGVKEPGFYQVQWNGLDADHQQVASGLYLYRMHSGAYVSVKKMMLLK